MRTMDSLGPPTVGHWFHLSTRIREDRQKLCPSDNGDNRASDEWKYPRVCVCDTIVGCISAISCVIGTIKAPCGVYVTPKPVMAFKCIDPNVSDVHFTNEHWIVEDTCFVRIGQLKHELSNRLGRTTGGAQVECGGIGGSLAGQHQHKNWMVRLFKKNNADILNRPWTTKEVVHSCCLPFTLGICEQIMWKKPMITGTECLPS